MMKSVCTKNSSKPSSNDEFDSCEGKWLKQKWSEEKVWAGQHSEDGLSSLIMCQHYRNIKKAVEDCWRRDTQKTLPEWSCCSLGKKMLMCPSEAAIIFITEHGPVFTILGMKKGREGEKGGKQKRGKDLQIMYRVNLTTLHSVSSMIRRSIHHPRVADELCQIPFFFPTVLSLLHLISKKGAETAGREKPEWHSPAANLERTNNKSLWEVPFSPVVSAPPTSPRKTKRLLSKPCGGSQVKVKWKHPLVLP